MPRARVPEETPSKALTTIKNGRPRVSATACDSENEEMTTASGKHTELTRDEEGPGKPRNRPQHTGVGRLLLELRRRHGLRRKTLAVMLNWSYDRLKNVELLNPRTGRPRTYFYREDLVDLFEVLEEVGWYRVGGRLFCRFEEAISRQWPGDDA